MRSRFSQQERYQLNKFQSPGLPKGVDTFRLLQRGHCQYRSNQHQKLLPICALETPLNPSAGNARITAAAEGSKTPGSGET